VNQLQAILNHLWQLLECAAAADDDDDEVAVAFYYQNVYKCPIKTWSFLIDVACWLNQLFQGARLLYIY